MMHAPAGAARATLLLLAALALLAVRGDHAHAQSLQGRVVDEETGSPVAGARIVVRTGVDLHRSESDEDGRFLLQVRRAGEHRVEVAHPDYADVRTMSVNIPDGQAAQVVIRLSRNVIRGDTLVVVAAARDRFHDATWEGALARREQLPDYGFRRVVTREDVELASAFDIKDVFNWFPPMRCAAVYHDGRFVQSVEWRQGWFESSAALVEAVEFYHRAYHAPRAFREPGFSECSVVALWSRREPSNTRRPLLKLAGAVAASALVVLLIR